MPTAPITLLNSVISEEFTTKKNIFCGYQVLGFTAGRANISCCRICSVAVNRSNNNKTKIDLIMPKQGEKNESFRYFSV